MPLKQIRKSSNSNKVNRKGKSLTKKHSGGAVYTFDLTDSIGGQAARLPLNGTRDGDCPSANPSDLALGNYAGGRRRSGKRKSGYKKMTKKSNKSKKSRKGRKGRSQMGGKGGDFFGFEKRKKAEREKFDEENMWKLSGEKNTTQFDSGNCNPTFYNTKDIQSWMKYTEIQLYQYPSIDNKDDSYYVKPYIHIYRDSDNLRTKTNKYEYKSKFGGQFNWTTKGLEEVVNTKNACRTFKYEN